MSSQQVGGGDRKGPLVGQASAKDARLIGWAFGIVLVTSAAIMIVLALTGVISPKISSATAPTQQVAGTMVGSVAGAVSTPLQGGPGTAAQLEQVLPPSATSTPEPPTSTPTLVPFAGDPVATAQPAPNLSSQHYFTETGHLVSGDFWQFYSGIQKNGDLFGFPLSEAFAQKLPDGSVYKVQYFERARIEYHPELPQGRRVQLGALEPYLLDGRNFDPVAVTSTNSSALYFPQTGHSISGGFLTYWQANGGLPIFGLPLSEEIGDNGMTVQYFERARMEYHPEFLGTGYAIQLSPVGFQALRKGGYNMPMGTLVWFNPPKVAEGHTTELDVAASPGITITGQYEGRPLLFTSDPAHDTAYSLVGAVPFQDVGAHNVTLTFENGDGGRRVVTRTLETVSYPFPEESLQFTPSTAALLNPDITGPELQQLNAIFSGRTPQKYWDGQFIMPLTGPIRITSYFATRRCYSCPDGSKPTTYHGGMDMAANLGTPVHAPAAGRIVFAGPLQVRGNVIIIDHGLGVYSLFAHNSQLIAKVGQFVQQGDVISLSGSTGLSNGPHLHWELHVSGPGVEPREWVNRLLP